MDNLSNLGRGVSDVLQPTYQIYGDILRQPENKAKIQSANCETFSYGSHDRHKLDLYRPSLSAPKPARGKSRPVLIFVCGGGFVHGDRILSEVPGGIVYKNLGYFFAEKFGFETVVMEYLLLKHGAKLPSGAEDIDSILEWVQSRFGKNEKNERKIFLMGNSAGGVHVATWLFGEWFRQRREMLSEGMGSIRLGGIVLLGAPFNWNASSGELLTVLASYYGSQKDIKVNEPMELMKRATEGDIGRDMQKWPRLMVLVSELDPEDMMIQSAKDFVEEWKYRGGKADFEILKGHNHISPPLALGTGLEREELWGFEVGRWISVLND